MMKRALSLGEMALAWGVVVVLSSAAHAQPPANKVPFEVMLDWENLEKEFQAITRLYREGRRAEAKPRAQRLLGELEKLREKVPADGQYCVYRMEFAGVRPVERTVKENYPMDPAAKIATLRKLIAEGEDFGAGNFLAEGEAAYAAQQYQQAITFYAQALAALEKAQKPTALVKEKLNAAGNALVGQIIAENGRMGETDTEAALKAKRAKVAGVKTLAESLRFPLSVENENLRQRVLTTMDAELASFQELAGCRAAMDAAQTVVDLDELKKKALAATAQHPSGPSASAWRQLIQALDARREWLSKEEAQNAFAARKDAFERAQDDQVTLEALVQQLAADLKKYEESPIIIQFRVLGDQVTARLQVVRRTNQARDYLKQQKAAVEAAQEIKDLLALKETLQVHKKDFADLPVAKDFDALLAAVDQAVSARQSQNVEKLLAAHRAQLVGARSLEELNQLKARVGQDKESFTGTVFAAKFEQLSGEIETKIKTHRTALAEKLLARRREEIKGAGSIAELAALRGHVAQDAQTYHDLPLGQQIAGLLAEIDAETDRRRQEEAQHALATRQGEFRGAGGDPGRLSALLAQIDQDLKKYGEKSYNVPKVVAGLQKLKSEVEQRIGDTQEVLALQQLAQRRQEFEAAQDIEAMQKTLAGTVEDATKYGRLKAAEEFRKLKESMEKTIGEEKKAWEALDARAKKALEDLKSAEAWTHEPIDFVNQ